MHENLKKCFQPTLVPNYICRTGRALGSFSELAPLTSCFSIKHLGALLHVNDLEVPNRKSVVTRNGPHLTNKLGPGAE